MKLIELIPRRPYLLVRDVEDSSEAEFAAGYDSEWILLDEKEFEVFKQEVKDAGLLY